MHESCFIQFFCSSRLIILGNFPPYYKYMLISQSLLAIFSSVYSFLHQIHNLYNFICRYFVGSVSMITQFIDIFVQK